MNLSLPLKSASIQAFRMYGKNMPLAIKQQVDILHWGMTKPPHPIQGGKQYLILQPATKDPK